MTATSSVIDIHLRVPADRSSCATWLLSQEPVVVAEALSLCEAALAAVQRDACEGESARLQKAHHVQVRSLQEQLEQERELRKEVLREAKQRAEAAAASLERQHKDSVDALQQQLASSQEACHRTQQSAAEQRASWQKEIEAQLQRTEETHTRRASLLQQKLDELDTQLAEARTSKQRLIDDVDRQTQRSAAEQKAFWQKELEEQARRCEEAFSRKAAVLQQQLEELDAQLTEARSSKQRLVDDATATIKRRLEEDRERRETQLLAEIDSLKRDMELKKGNEAQALLQEKRHSEDLLLQREAEHQRTVQQLKDDRLKYESFLTEALEKRSAELAEAVASKDAAAQRVEALVLEHRDLVARLGGATARGQMGERFVANVFARLQLGDWHDDHATKEEGFADALWTWQASPTTPALSCLVEVKYVADLHTQHDIAKFHRDLQAAAHNNRANAGLFISLAKHYPGKPSLQLTVEHGLPVCWASRNEDDPLPAASLVQLAFQAMATAWPLICRQRGEGVELTVRAAAEQLEDQLSKCTSLSKHIESVARSASSLLREAKALEKLRDSMVKGIECVRMNHPSLVPEAPDAVSSVSEEVAVDPWNSVGAQQFLAAIVAGKKGPRYPKESDLTLEAEAARFVQATPQAFLIALDRLKKDTGSKGRKRKAAASDGGRGEADEAADGE
jgi:hypothetical protein